MIGALLFIFVIHISFNEPTVIPRATLDEVAYIEKHRYKYNPRTICGNYINGTNSDGNGNR